MNALKVYVDTSVFGAVFDTEDPRRVRVTESLLRTLALRDRFLPYVSNIVLEEAGKAPEEVRGRLMELATSAWCGVLKESEACIGLVKAYVGRGVVPARYRDDARHIAVAVVNGMDLIVTWNCRHMANVAKKRAVNAVNASLGYEQIDIVTPPEVVGHG